MRGGYSHVNYDQSHGDAGHVVAAQAAGTRHDVARRTCSAEGDVPIEIPDVLSIPHFERYRVRGR
jgi:hypothetical protein